MKDLNIFFDIDWIDKTPEIIVVDDSDYINFLNKKPAVNYSVIAWSDFYYRNIFITKKNNSQSDERYVKIIKHELAHQFFWKLTQKERRPFWLSEGCAIYLSREIDDKQVPERFVSFLKFYDITDKEIYTESGFVIKFLVEKFGKQKLLKLITNISEFKDDKFHFDVDNNKSFRENFDKSFENIYGFELNYKNLNHEYEKFYKINLISYPHGI